MKKRYMFFMLVLIFIVGVNLSGCTTNADTVTSMMNLMHDNTYKTMDFIISNKFGEKITNLEFNKNEAEGSSTLSFKFCNTIGIRSSIEYFKDISKPTWQQLVLINAPTKIEYSNDISVITTYLMGVEENKSEKFKKLLKESMQESIDNPDKQISINYGNDSYILNKDNEIKLLIRKSVE